MSTLSKLNETVKNVLYAENLEEAQTYSGLGEFSSDESMLDDLEYDLKLAGLSSKDYKMDMKKGTITFHKSTPKLKSVISQYNLKSSMKEDIEEVQEESVEEAKDLDKDTVTKALQHDCAKHVVHESLGYGVCIRDSHIMEENVDGSTGNVTHYDVVFENGIRYQNVPVSDLKIMFSENHMGTGKKKKADK